MDVQLLTSSDVDRRRAPLPLRLVNDERLARLVGQGREDAFAELYGRYHQRLFRYCRSIVGSDTDAQDALQTAFARALVALRDSRRDAPVRPWLYRIAHNESISLLRRRRPERELPDELTNVAPAAHEVADERAELGTLLADLAELPERQRGALVMRELSGLGHEEIAAAFGITTGAAKQTIFEARRALQEFADGRAMDCRDVQRLVSDGDGRAMRARRVRAHLRDCGTCAAFASAIPARQAKLRAYTPVLPATAAAGLLARLTGGGCASTGAAAGGLGGGAALSGAGTLLSGKALMTGAAVLATVALGTETVHRIDAPPSAPSAPARATPGTTPARAQSAPATSTSSGPASPASAATTRSATSARGIGPAISPATARHAEAMPGSRATSAASRSAHRARATHGTDARGGSTPQTASARGNAYGRASSHASTGGNGAAAVAGASSQGKAVRTRARGSSPARQTSTSSGQTRRTSATRSTSAHGTAKTSGRPATASSPATHGLALGTSRATAAPTTTPTVATTTPTLPSVAAKPHG